LDGFLSAALNDDISNVTSCLNDTDALIVDINQFVVDIKHGFNLKDLVTDLYKLLIDARLETSECTEFASQVNTAFTLWETQLENPGTVAQIIYTVIAKHQEARLKGDATAFVAKWNAGNYTGSGLELGDIPYVLFDMNKNGATSVQSLLKQL